MTSHLARPPVWPEFAPGFVLVALVYPLLEELTFRGLIQGYLIEIDSMKRQWLGFTLANLLVSILFVACHLFYHSMIWSMLIFVPSLVFGYFRDRTGSPVASIGLHSWYNAGFYFLYSN